MRVKFDFFTLALAGIMISIVASFSGILYGFVVYYLRHNITDLFIGILSVGALITSVYAAAKFVEWEN